MRTSIPPHGHLLHYDMNSLLFALVCSTAAGGGVRMEFAGAAAAKPKKAKPVAFCSAFADQPGDMTFAESIRSASLRKRCCNCELCCRCCSLSEAFQSCRRASTRHETQ